MYGIREKPAREVHTMIEVKARVGVSEWTTLRFLIDSGAMINLFSPLVIRKSSTGPLQSERFFRGLTGALTSGSNREARLELHMEGKDSGGNLQNFRVKAGFVITEMGPNASCDGILGHVWMCQNNIMIDPPRHRIIFPDGWQNLGNIDYIGGDCEPMGSLSVYGVDSPQTLEGPTPRVKELSREGWSEFERINWETFDDSKPRFWDTWGMGKYLKGQYPTGKLNKELQTENSRNNREEGAQTDFGQNQQYGSTQTNKTYAWGYHREGGTQTHNDVKYVMERGVQTKARLREILVRNNGTQTDHGSYVPPTPRHRSNGSHWEIGQKYEKENWEEWYKEDKKSNQREWDSWGNDELK